LASLLLVILWFDFPIAYIPNFSLCRFLYYWSLFALNYLVTGHAFGKPAGRANKSFVMALGKPFSPLLFLLPSAALLPMVVMGLELWLILLDFNKSTYTD